MYFAAGVLHGQVFAVSVSILQYFFLLPTFLIGFPIYSYCNIHDISWGTKGLENSDLGESANRKQKEAQAEQIAKRKETLEAVDAKFRTFRSNMVIGTYQAGRRRSPGASDTPSRVVGVQRPVLRADLADERLEERIPAGDLPRLLRHQHVQAVLLLHLRRAGLDRGLLPETEASGGGARHPNQRQTAHRRHQRRRTVGRARRRRRPPCRTG